VEGLAAIKATIRKVTRKKRALSIFGKIQNQGDHDEMTKGVSEQQQREKIISSLK